jgi:hypothetical protein
MNMGGFTASVYLTPDGDVEVESFIDIGSIESETSRYSVGRAQGDYAPCIESTVPDAFTIEDCIRGCLLYGNEGHDWADGGAAYVGGWVRDGHQWVFDPVYLCETLDDALYYGVLYNQDEVFDLYTGESIPVGGPSCPDCGHEGGHTLNTWTCINSECDNVDGVVE